MSKKERQRRILDLIQTSKFETQEELLSKLLEEGYSVTQATISRDLRELHLVKSLNHQGNYAYTLSNDVSTFNMPSFSAVLTDSIKSVNYAGNLIVIKTYPGMAQAVATCIDSIETGEIIGCVAGDDAIIAVAIDEIYAEAVSVRIRNMTEENKKSR